MKCWICGDEATTTRTYKKQGDTIELAKPSKFYRCYCEKCKADIDEKERQELEIYVRLRKQQMLRKACEILENQETDMYEYRDAIDVVKEHITEHPDKYDSSYEVLAAIVLVYNRIRARMQQKIGRYQVDFMLPEWFVILEIDGDRHKHRKDYDSKRDRYIKEQLGEMWQIVRINTELLDMDAKKLPQAIEKVLDYRDTKHINWRTL